MPPAAADCFSNPAPVSLFSISCGLSRLLACGHTTVFRVNRKTSHSSQPKLFWSPHPLESMYVPASRSLSPSSLCLAVTVAMIDPQSTTLTLGSTKISSSGGGRRLVASLPHTASLRMDMGEVLYSKGSYRKGQPVLQQQVFSLWENLISKKYSIENL